jgi:hypothetical protein
VSGLFYLSLVTENTTGLAHLKALSHVENGTEQTGRNIFNIKLTLGYENVADNCGVVHR